MFVFFSGLTCNSCADFHLGPDTPESDDVIIERVPGPSSSGQCSPSSPPVDTSLDGSLTTHNDSILTTPGFNLEFSPPGEPSSMSTRSMSSSHNGQTPVKGPNFPKLSPSCDESTASTARENSMGDNTEVAVFRRKNRTDVNTGIV